MKRTAVALIGLALLATLLVSPAAEASIPDYPAVPSVCANVASSTHWGYKTTPDSRSANPGRFCLRYHTTGVNTILYFTGSTSHLLLATCGYHATSCHVIWSSNNTAVRDGRLTLDSFCNIKVETWNYRDWNNGVQLQAADSYCQLYVGRGEVWEQNRDHNGVYHVDWSHSG